MGFWTHFDGFWGGSYNFFQVYTFLFQREYCYGLKSVVKPSSRKSGHGYAIFSLTIFLKARKKIWNFFSRNFSSSLFIRGRGTPGPYAFGIEDPSRNMLALNGILAINPTRFFEKISNIFFSQFFYIFRKNNFLYEFFFFRVKIVWNLY